MRIIGVDPGFASTGAVVLETIPGQEKRERSCLDFVCLQRIETPPAAKKIRAKVGQTADKDRRIRELFHAIEDVVEGHGAEFGAVEEYLPFKGQASSICKGAAAMTTVKMVFEARGMGWVSVTPQERPSLLLGKRGGSKDEVYEAAREWLDSTAREILARNISELPKTAREHCKDAAAIAVCGFIRIRELRKFAALGGFSE